MTDERRAAAEAKRRATYQRKRQREQDKKAERENTIRILREIRDSDEATPAERLQAIEMLSGLLPKY